MITLGGREYDISIIENREGEFVMIRQMEEGDIKGGGIIRKDFLPGITSAHATVRILFAILLMLLFAVIALATPSASSDIEIYAFDQNPAGSDKGKIYIPSMINLMPWKSGNQN